MHRVSSLLGYLPSCHVPIKRLFELDEKILKYRRGTGMSEGILVRGLGTAGWYCSTEPRPQGNGPHSLIGSAPLWSRLGCAFKTAQGFLFVGEVLKHQRELGDTQDIPNFGA